jgi:hypothetical protein
VEAHLISISITSGELCPLLESIGQLEAVKLDALSHAETAIQAGLDAAARALHRKELGQVRALRVQVEKAVHARRPVARVTGRRALLEEIVHGALIAQAEALADRIVGLDSAAAPDAIAVRVRVIDRLVRTLATLRSRASEAPVHCCKTSHYK